VWRIWNSDWRDSDWTVPDTQPISPAFGHADLSNCERELIHLAASVQPYGLLLVASEPDLSLLQITGNCTAMLGLTAEQLLGRSLAALGGSCADDLQRLLDHADTREPTPFQCTLAPTGQTLRFEGITFRHADGVVILELEPLDSPTVALPTAPIAHALLMQGVSAAVQDFSAASSLGTLADAIAKSVHDLTGFDRVMVYKFDADGHGKVIAEARDPRLDSLLGHNYPSTDIPQRARALYLRNRVRLLVDVNYQPAPLLPRLLPATGADLDMSLCQLRSMSPLHLQYLKNMGVTATLVVSLVREGRLWGLIAAHHYTPRHLRFAVRAACDLLAEVAATRIAAIENYAHAQVALLVQRLEQRLVEATSVEGDWRLALFRNPSVVLQPLEATGVALFHGGEILTAGEVPSTPELKALLRWLEDSGQDSPFVCSSVAKAQPALASLTPMASGVLAVKLSISRPDYLIWFRKEQLQSVTWAGDPNKPFAGDSPLELSPRRSFAAWSEIVRGTALPWSAVEIALARAVGVALVDIIVQVEAVRLLIGENQLAHMRAAVKSSRAAVAVADAQGRVLYASDAFWQLFDSTARAIETLDDLSAVFLSAQPLQQAFASLGKSRQSWRGEGLLQQAGQSLPLALRAEAVLGRDGALVGFVVSFADQSDAQRASSARHQLESSLQPAGRDADEIILAILTNASMAAMDIADGPHDATTAPQLNEVEQSAHRAARLYRRIRSFDSNS
jgi:light-regulated signal transduction histidine kinase (bacteriophytochrome)